VHIRAIGRVQEYRNPWEWTRVSWRRTRRPTDRCPGRSGCLSVHPLLQQVDRTHHQRLLWGAGDEGARHVGLAESHVIGQNPTLASDVRALPPLHPMFLPTPPSERCHPSAPLSSKVEPSFVHFVSLLSPFVAWPFDATHLRT
jgi:hypothetical protein